MKTKKQIGWFVLHEDMEFRNTYECAAWYENVLVKAGKYPMEVDDYKIREREDGREVDGYIGQVTVELPGTITSDEFGALFYGVPVGTYDNYKNKGKESAYYFHQYLYGIANAILHPVDSIYASGKYSFELLPEYEAKEYHFEYDGEDVELWGIFEKGGDVDEKQH